MRRILIAIAVLLCLVVLAPIAVLAVLQTQAARDMLAQKVSATLTTPERTVRLVDPVIDWDGTIHAGAVIVGDAKGTWLEARTIRAAWSPLALLDGRLSIGSVRVGSVSVARQPEAASEEAVQPTEPPAEGGGGIPLSIDIPQIRIGEIQLAEPVAGTPIRLTAVGSLRLRPDPAIIEAALHVERDDDVAGRFDAAIGYVQNTSFLRIDLRAAEPAGGLVARLLQMDALPAVDATLTGEGPLDAWHGRLSVALNRVETVTGRVDMTRSGENRQVALALDGAVADILPPGMRDVFAGAMHVKGTAALTNDYLPLGGNLEMVSDAFTLTGKGDYDRATGSLSANLEGELSRAVTWGEAQSRLSAEQLRLTASAQGTLNDAQWHATVEAAGLKAPQARLATLSLDVGGDNADFRTASRDVPMTVDAAATLAEVTDPQLKPFLGPLRVAAKARIGTESLLDLQTADIQTGALTASLSGTYAAQKASLSGDVAVPDLDAFSELAGRALSGTLAAHVTATGNPAAQSGTVKLDATADRLATDDDRVAKLLGGTASLTGTFSRNESGSVEFSDVKLASDGLTAALSGQSDMETVEAEVDVTVPDLAPLDPRISGGLAMNATLSGALAAPEVEAHVESDRLVMQGEPIEDLVITATSRAPDGRAQGSARIEANYRGQPLTASADFETAADGARRLSDIAVSAVSARLNGRLALSADGKPSGVIDLSAPDLAEIGPLLLQELAGSLDARIEIDEQNGTSTARITANAKDVRRGDLTVASATLNATVVDPLATPRIEGTLAARRIHQGGMTVTRLDGRAKTDGTNTDFSADADLEGGRLAIAGDLKPERDGFAITLAKAEGGWKGIDTRLTRQARILVTGGKADLSDVVLALGNGSAAISGSAGEKLDIDVRLDSVPVSLANAVAPGLGLSGSVSGTAHAGGAAGDPAATWNLTWSGASASQISAYGLPNMTVKSEGQFKDKRVTHTTVATIGSGTLTAKGAVGIGAQPTSLDMSVNGTLPLQLAQRKLLEAGLRMEGAANLDMTIGGTVASPTYGGTLSASDLTAVGLDTGIVVKSLSVNARFSQQQIEITSLSGTSGGGRISGGGTIGLGSGMPADLTLTIDDATYQDGAVVKARFDANLKLSGPLSGSPLLAGTVNLKQTDITIPETVGGKISPLSVKHVNAPADVQQQSATLNKSEGGGDDVGGTIRLDLTVNAPSRMFVRGRGLQAELSGTIKIQGTSGSPLTSGAFTLRRGTLGVLSRQLTFTKGTITFLGSFDPRLDFAATTSTSNAEVTVSVAGNASDPKITFSSVPDLPQDEILAQLLFGQSLDNLSPTQIAQLASAVATLGGNDPLDRLRQTLGVDSINVTTDANNNAAVNIGKNIGEKLRLGVQQGTEASSGRVTIDLDINKSLKARGEVGENGESKAGIFFEREY